jgi:hypothetical protein
MGNFYVNFSVKRDDPTPVVDALRRAGCHAVVTPPSGGYVVAFEEDSDAQDPSAIARVGALLSGEAKAPVLAVLNHDDDVFCYWLFEGGHLSDTYNSCPDYFDEDDDSEPGGDAVRLCAALSAPGPVNEVEKVLRDDGYTFELERHQRLVELLGLPVGSVGMGYGYVESGEVPEGVTPDQLQRVG